MSGAEPGDTRNRWLIADPEGRIVAQADLPSGLDVQEIGDEYVLGVTRDEMDVERVQVHRLVRG